MNSLQLKEFARQCGADVVGIADLTLLKGIETEPKNLLEGYTRAVSVAAVLCGRNHRPHCRFAYTALPAALSKGERFA